MSGTSVDGHSAKKLRYSDDILLIAESKIQLQEIADLNAIENQHKGLSLSRKQ